MQEEPTFAQGTASVVLGSDLAPMVNYGDKRWIQNLSLLERAFSDFQSGGIDMDDAFRVVEKMPDSLSADIKEFLLDVISEIDGFPKLYRDVHEDLRTRISLENFILKYIIEH